MKPLIHFPCNETSGNTMTCDVTGTVVTSTQDMEGVTSNGIEWGLNTMSVTKNNVSKVIRHGVVLYYFSGWFDGTIVTSNNKMSLNHISVYGNTRIDIQRTESDDNTFSNIVYGQTGWNLDGFSVGTTILGADSLHTYNGGEFAGVIRLPMNSKELPVLIRDDGKVFTYSYSAPVDYATWANGEVGYPEFNLTPSATGVPAVLKTPPVTTRVEDLWTPIFRYCRLYEWGVWAFTHHNPSIEELKTFAAWLYTQSRAGNKEHYPPFVSVGREPT